MLVDGFTDAWLLQTNLCNKLITRNIQKKVYKHLNYLTLVRLKKQCHCNQY